MRRALFALLLFLPLIPAAASAQLTRFEVTPFVGYRLTGEVDNSADIGFDFRSDVEIDEAPTYGLIFDIPLSPNWQLELMASRQNTSFTVDEGLLSPSENLGDVDLNLFQAGFLLQWGEGQVSPFAVATLGLARLEPDFVELDAENYLAGTVGGGIKVFLSENVGLRFEGRGTWIDLETDFDNRYDRYDSDGVTWLPEGAAGVVFSW
jgi:opacity protein-like surface antigen